MSKTEIKRIIREYGENLKKERFPFSSIYLFGSYAKGNYNKDSDIDIAIVSDISAENMEKKRLSIWRARRNVDYRIEPHLFTEKDFANNSDPLAYEIRKTGFIVI
ncbi:MAG: nucleotidyltransferase domain-containing protein [Nanoarchaeota archaeon]|nr:nucleotidyltransferase domain-containing protein [Nanoarchaeota archaeon]